LIAAAAAIVAVLCCVALPLAIGVAGTLTSGALLGIAAGGIVLAAVCLFVARRLISNKGC
jgi:hypothetical protein